MAARTSNGTGGGSLASGASWSGGVAPVAGDTIVVANGDVITIDADISLGSNSGNVGHAFTINGASTISFGTLSVSAGVTLTLKGNDLTTNTMGLVNKFGKFLPQPGSTISGDCASNYQSIILNKGRFEAFGSIGSRITFTCPAGNISWANSVASEAISGTSWPYDTIAKIAVWSLANPWVSNSGGTALGSLASSSLSWSSKTPSGILATEVATLALVTSVGKYYVDYDMGLVYFYHDPADGNPSATAAYKNLSTGKGWGISSTQNTSDNTFIADYSDFLYMGTTTSADTRCLDVQNKQSAAAAADNRLFKLSNSTVRYCYRFLGMKACTGTLADPILVTGNSFYTCKGDSTFGTTIATYRSQLTYCSFTSNVLNTSAQFYQSIAPFGSVGTNVCVLFTGNTGICQDFFTGTINATTFTTGSSISGNTLSGIGWCKDYRFVQGFGGTGAGQATVTGNVLNFMKRCCHFVSYLDITKNSIGHSSHHSISSDVTDDVYITGVNVQNNLFWGSMATGSVGGKYGRPAVEVGYNHRQWIANVVVSNNTMIDNEVGFVGFGDCQDTSFTNLVTNVDVSNNLALMNTAGTSTAYKRTIGSTTELTRLSVRSFDYNLDYNYNTRIGTGAPKQGTFTLSGAAYNTSGARNITGVNVFAPSYTTTFAGKTLTYTVNSADSDVTLTWDGGSAVQLIFATNGTGTATAGANTSSNGITGLSSGTVTNSGAGWSTTLNNAGCPRGHWIKTTGGTGSGQVRAIVNNTATVLTTVPAWSTVPDNTTTYAIYKSEVTLTAGDASTVNVGTDPGSLPASTKSDTIDFAVHTVNSDPLLTTPTAQTATVANYQFTSSSSPAKDAGTSTNAPTDDYSGTARPQGTGTDIGFFELVATTATGTGGGPTVFIIRHHR